MSVHLSGHTKCVRGGVGDGETPWKTVAERSDHAPLRSPPRHESHRQSGETLTPVPQILAPSPQVPEHAVRRQLGEALETAKDIRGRGTESKSTSTGADSKRSKSACCFLIPLEEAMYGSSS
jgi:hypothetical protein